MKLRAGHNASAQENSFYWLIEPECADYVAVFNEPSTPDWNHDFIRGDDGPLHLLMCQEHCTSVDVISEDQGLCGSNTQTAK